MTADGFFERCTDSGSRKLKYSHSTSARRYTARAAVLLFYCEADESPINAHGCSLHSPLQDCATLTSCGAS